MLDHRTTRLAASLVLLAAALLLGNALATSVSEPVPAMEAATASSYASLRPLLREGVGKDNDEGVIELFQFGNPDPAAWLEDIVNPQTGVRETWKVKHVSYVEGAEIPTTYESIPGPGPGPASLAGLLDWIVNEYPHVQSLADLTPVLVD